MQNKISYSAVLAAALLLSSCSYMPSWMGGRGDTTPPVPGERLEVLPRQASVQVDDSLANLPVKVPAVNENASWPQHTGSFTSESGNLAVGDLGQQQEARIGDGEEFEHTLIPRPVVADGKVFAMDAAGFVTAHEASNIDNTLWKSPGVSEEDEPAIIGGGLAYDNGKLYVVSGRGLVVAQDAATGKALWRKATGIPFRSAPKVEGDMLYAVSIDSQVYAFSAATGDIVWSQRGIRETAGILRSVSPVVANNMVIVPFPSGEIYALSALDGRELWAESLATPARNWAASVFAGIGGDPVVDGSVVFAVSTSGVFSVFNLTNGQKYWEYPVSSLNTPWVAGDHVYLLTNDNVLVNFVKYDGRVRWATALPSFEDEEDKRGTILWNGPVMAGSNLLVVGNNGQMLMVSALDGSVVRKLEIEEGITTPPVVAGGAVYLVDKDANLHALK